MEMSPDVHLLLEAGLVGRQKRILWRARESIDQEAAPGRGLQETAESINRQESLQETFCLVLLAERPARTHTDGRAGGQLSPVGWVWSS